MGLLRALVPSSRSVAPVRQVRRRSRTPHRDFVSARSGTRFPLYIGDPGLEHNEELQGTNWYGSPGTPGVAIEMMRDSHMRAAYALGTNPIRTGSWVVEPGGEDSESKKCAAALEWNLFQELNFDAFLEKLLYVHRDGFSLHEITSDYLQFPSEFAPSVGLGLKYTGFEHIPAWTVSRFDPSPRNNRQVKSIGHYVGDMTGVLEEHTLSMKNIFRFTMGQEGSEFRGFPTNRSCYGPWFLKLGYQTINSIKQDRFGIGIPYAKQPEAGPMGTQFTNDDDVASVNFALSEIRVNERGYINLPAGWDIGLLSFDTDMDTDLLQSIEFCNRDMFLTWGAGFASMGDTKFGSFALGKVHDKHHYLNNRAFCNSLEAALKFGCDGWGLATRFRDANFPGAQVPKIRVKELQSRDWLADLAELDKFVRNGMIPQYDALSAHIADVVEAPVPDAPFSEIIERNRQQAMQDKMAMSKNSEDGGDNKKKDDE